MRRLATLAWWAAALPLLPLAVPLAIRTRRRALRLAPAAGPREGLVGGSGAEEPLRLLLFGESTVAGVGASCLDYALAGRLAAALGERLRRPVAWQALGENGITSGEARERLLPQVAGRFFDQVILVFGVNDTTSLRSLERWRADCAALIDGFQAAGAQVTCTAVPPLQHFSALPGLLRALLGGARAAARRGAVRSRWRDRRRLLPDLAGPASGLPGHRRLSSVAAGLPGLGRGPRRLVGGEGEGRRRGSLSETQDTAPRSLSRVSFRHSTASRLSSAAAET